MKRVLILLLSISPSMAQVPLSMEQCRDMALSSSENYEISQRQVDISTFKYRESNSARLPSLDLAASAAYSMWDSEDKQQGLRDYNYGASLILSQPIYSGGGLISSSRAAKLAISQSELESQRLAQEVIYNASQAYYLLLATRDKLQATEDYVEIVERLYAIIKIRYSEGYISRSDVLMVETRLNEADLQRLTAQRAYYGALSNLNYQVGSEELTEYILVDSMATPVSLPKTESLEYALENRGDYRALHLASDIDSIDITISRAAFNPTLSLELSGNYGTPTPNAIGVRDQHYGTAQLSLSAPIFNFGARGKRVAQAKLQRTISELDISRSHSDIAYELQSSLIELHQSYSEVQLSIENRRIADENLSLSTFSYQEGKLPILDVLSAQLSWISANISSIESLYDYYSALNSYELAVGNIQK